MAVLKCTAVLIKKNTTELSCTSNGIKVRRVFYISLLKYVIQAAGRKQHGDCKFDSVYNLIQILGIFLPDILRHGNNAYFELLASEDNFDQVACLEFVPGLCDFIIYKHPALLAGFFGNRASFYYPGVFQILIQSHRLPHQKVKERMTEQPSAALEMSQIIC